jgi:hypothetical protein
VDGIGQRRSPLLAALLCLFLIGLAGPVKSASHQLIAGSGEAVLAATADTAVTARTTAERLSPVHRSSPLRHLPVSASLPAAVLLAFLLALRAARRRALGTAPQLRLATTAGRGPPVTS